MEEPEYMCILQCMGMAIISLSLQTMVDMTKS